MKTLLYNLDTQTAGPMREGRYVVDGQTGIYPSNYIELVVYDPPNPSYNADTQKLEFSSYYADAPDLLWTRDKTVVDMTQEEIDDRVIEQEKIQKEVDFNNAVGAGYLDPNTSITFGINDGDRIMWNQFLTLINTQLDAGSIQASSTVTVLDITGMVHQITVAQAKQAISDLGLYYYNLWVNKNN